MSKRVGLSLLALLIVFGGSAFGQNIIFPGTTPTTDQNASNWSFENGLSGWFSSYSYSQAWGGFMGSSSDPGTPYGYARSFIPGGVAAYITTDALAGAIYGATAALARNSANVSWTFQLFMGGTPGFAATPSGATLLAASNSGTAPPSGSVGAANWSTFGIEATAGAVEGESIWLRILASGSGEIGIDAVLGVETPCVDDDCAPPPGIPEPLTMGLVGSGFLGLALFRRIRR